jgi:hypothetical protein
MSGSLVDLPKTPLARESLAHDLRGFAEFGQATRCTITRAGTFAGDELEIPTFINEFWTPQQRAANRLHEISYRACFKPQLPRFFIQRLTQPGEIVYDPFMGRGTTLIEAALLGRVPFGCDINPLSAVLTRPRLLPPLLSAIEKRLRSLNLTSDPDPLSGDAANPLTPPREDLLVFFHPQTLDQIVRLKNYFLRQRDSLDTIDDWIRMVAINRLTGHSAGFFSVYTLPPNQAISAKAQRKINADRNQTPSPRDIVEIILKKSRSLLSEIFPATRSRDELSISGTDPFESWCGPLENIHQRALLLTQEASNTRQIPDAAVSLVVTSPPFLDVVDYAGDNWLRCWFLGIDPKSVRLTVPKKLADWQKAMTAVFRELHRLLKPGGHIAFEVGEVHGGKTKLEETVLPCGLEAGLTAELILINDQEFTKTANCWGVDNNAKGTNTNRIVVFRKA